MLITLRQSWQRWVTFQSGILAAILWLSFCPMVQRAQDDASPATNAPAAKASSKAEPDPFATKGPKPINLAPSSDDPAITRLVTRILTRSHYARKPFDDTVSSRFLDQYLDMLDPTHLIFFQTDLQEFERYRNTLDDLTYKDGDTTPAYVIFKRFLERFDQEVEFANQCLTNTAWEFKGNETYKFERKNADRPRDLQVAKTLWLERLRYEYLQEKLNQDKPEEIAKIIKRRYSRISRFLHEYDSEEVLQIYLTALSHVYDPHSDYMGKNQLDNFSIGMKLSLFGIGALLRSEDGYCKIQELMPGGPAAASKKIKPNDRIIAVSQGDEEAVDVVDMKLTKVVELIRGPKGTKVRLTIIPADAPDPSVRNVVTLIRDEIKLEEREAKAKVIELGGPDNLRLGVIDLPSFYAELPTAGKTGDLKSTTADVARLVKKLKAENVSGIILDLRHNGGGVLEESVELTGLFIKKGPVVQVRDSGGNIGVHESSAAAPLYDGPLIVLTSRFSASASEILAAALQDYGRALIVGDISTHGKGTVQQLLQLGPIMQQFGMATSQNPGALKITIRKFYRINGESTQLKGVTPDIVLPSVNNVADIGEQTSPNALPWDTIPTMKYEPLGRTKPILGELARRATARVATNADFAYVQVETERFQKIQNEKSVSMNEEVRRKEKTEAKDRQEARKKELRARPADATKTFEVTLKNADQPGLQPFVPKTNDVETASLKAKDPEDAGTEDDDVPVVDITLDEAQRILMDLVTLSKTPQGLSQVSPAK